MKLFSPFLALLIFTSSYSQNSKVDSLENELKNAKEDSTRIPLLNSLCKKIRRTNPDKAMKYADSALELSEKTNSQKGMADAYFNLGVVNKDKGNYPASMDFYFKALKIWEALNNTDGISYIYNNIGNLYYHQGKNELALENHFKALKIREETHDTSGLSQSYNNIGGIYSETGNYKAALDYQMKGLKIREKVNDRNEISASYNNIGLIYEKLADTPDAAQHNENLQKALEYQMKALQIQQEENDKRGLTMTYNSLGNIYEMQGKIKDAVTNQLLALAVSQEINRKEGIKEAIKSLSLLYAKENDYQQAYQYHKKYSDIKDSLLNEESSKQIAEMQTKYETEKKEQQIMLLNKDKELQDAQLNRQQIIIWSVAGGLLIVISLSIFIFRERRKSEKLLLNILPAETAKELKEKGKASPKYYKSVTVMFTDFKGFTTIAEKLSAEELVSELDFIFKKFDEIISKYNIEKIKTIGDAYMCASGLPSPNSIHAEEIVKAGMEIQTWMKGQNNKWSLRMGIHSGPVTAGVVGDKKFAYDIWGDTVNTASRMESSGEAGKINISGATYQLVKDSRLTKGGTGDYQFTHRGKIPAKNKGEIDMYFVEKPS